MSHVHKSAFNQIYAKKKRPWKGEEEVRLAWVSALEAGLGVHFDAERSNKDSSYNNVIIEFKYPGAFKGSKNSASFKEAMFERLLPYILRESAKSGIPAEDYIGIAIDGEHICFAQVINREIHSQHLIAFSEYAVGLIIEAIRSDVRRSVTAENLMYDFGHGSANGRELMQAMANGLAAELQNNENSKVKMLFEEWRTLYGQVADMSLLQANAISSEMAFGWPGRADQAMSGRLFVIHTYNSLLIKLLASEIVAAHGLTNSSFPAQAMSAVLDDNQLLATLLADIERAGIFSRAGIKGFVEEAIFSWYLDVARLQEHTKSIIPALRMLLGSLSLYRTDRLSHTRDVLRDLYQGLVPGKLRQSLGEFYTPDWLVDFTVEKARKGPWLTKRVLDPTCGSGAFLLAIIRNIKIEAIKAGWNDEKIVEHVCANVWGFDLNPLAVQTARVNFLMEIAGLLKPGQHLEIPVLLADAIYSPAPDPAKGQDIVSYKIGSQVAKLDISLPTDLALNRNRLDQVFEQMGGDVECNYEFEKSKKRLLAARLMSLEEAKTWEAPLKYTYDQILKLHRLQWNGIWFRIVRNFFWSATAGQFDCIVGNPPWVRWSKLPDAYRERVKPTCEGYGIFSKTKMHGGNELDISAMITYTTADKWLKPKGRLAFVITGTIFKNPSSAGFRKFLLTPLSSKPYYLNPVSVDDLKKLKPFEDASNHTVVATFEKTMLPVNYPVPYRLWETVVGSARAIPASMALVDVRKRVDVFDNEAVPVDGLGSPWAVLNKGRYKQMQGLAGVCSWVAGRKGITTDLNGVFFVRIQKIAEGLVQIASRPEAGKIDIGTARRAWVEPELLFPLVKGAGDFESCYLKLKNPHSEIDPLFTFLPNRGINGQEYEASEVALSTVALAKTKLWFSGFKALLNARSTYRRQMKGAPFFAVYNVGAYTFQKWKVIWPEMSTKFYAAVAGSAEVPLIGSRPYIPDHKVYFVGFDDKQPAYYLCGLMNSATVREWVQSHTLSIQVGDVFKHMQLPEYDPQNTDHELLWKKVELAHQQHDVKKRTKLVETIVDLADRIIAGWLIQYSGPSTHFKNN